MFQSLKVNRKLLNGYYKVRKKYRFPTLKKYAYTSTKASSTATTFSLRNIKHMEKDW